MIDRPTSHQDRLQQNAFRTGHAGPLPKKESEAEEIEIKGLAFGHLRGIRDRADAIEFRFRDSTTTTLSYSWLGYWRYNPSHGLLLKFNGDLVYLVLVRGSSLDLPLTEGGPNLIAGGIQRHRVVWMQEMSEADIRQVGEKGPTIDSIEVHEYESHAAVKDWLSKNAPAFVH